jgi:hypothetical protein
MKPAKGQPVKASASVREFTRRRPARPELSRVSFDAIARRRGRSRIDRESGILGSMGDDRIGAVTVVVMVICALTVFLVLWYS